MPREIEQPITEDSNSPVSETRTTHPAYAMIGASRCSGGHTSLYGSDFTHNAYMTITIRRSELHRGLNRDWHFGREEYIEVALSESQWATFVSAPNVGEGVPCTLQYRNGKAIPGLPSPESRVDQFSDEIQEQLQNCLKTLDAGIAAVQEVGLSKVKQDKLAGIFKGVRQEIMSNLPFVASQFSTHMEETVEKAKQEVHGYMLSAIQRAGLEAISGGTLPLQIEGSTND